MAQQFMLQALLAIMVFGSLCAAGGSHHKHIIIHVPYHVKHHHHTHTIYKHIKHIDHGHEHHDHHDHHDDDYKISFPGHYDFGGGWSGDYGSIGNIGDVGGGVYDGAFDSGSYENNNFGSLGWDDK